MSARIVIIYHSGYGHTAKVAEHVAAGAQSVAGAEVISINVEQLDDAGWAALDNAHAIIFGAPTYMAGVSARYKEFMDATSKRWFAQAWKDKLAAGFTNAGTVGGDNLNALYQLAMFALQHSMIWVGNGVMPVRDNGLFINRLGAFAGLMTQSGNDSPEVTPPQDDLVTAGRFGARVAEIAVKFI